MICLNCGENIDLTNKGANKKHPFKFCNSTCYKQYRAKNKTLRYDNCLVCGKKLDDFHNKFCSRECYFNRIKIQKLEDRFCQICGEKLKRYQETFCSKICLYKSRRGIRPINADRPVTILTRKKMSKIRKGKPRPQSFIEKMTGRKNDDDTLKLMRVSAKNRLDVKLGKKWSPNFNVKACEYFKKFDEEHNTKGQYALYGGGEYYINDLGYWLDYINHDKKIIIEVYEKHHYHAGLLKDKDVKREEEIKGLFADYKFVGINEDNLEENKKWPITQ